MRIENCYKYIWNHSDCIESPQNEDHSFVHISHRPLGSYPGTGSSTL